MIYSLYPSNQQKFTRGARIQFTAVAGDSDGDSLTYCWTLKGRRLSASPSFYKSDLPAGTHTLLLTVSDGKDTATASLTVEITPASGAGDMYYRLLAVALVVLSMVLGWLLAVPRRPQNVPNLSAEDAEPAGDEKDDGVVDVEAEEE